MEDKQFTTQFLAVLITLTGIAIAILIVANAFYSGDSGITDEGVQKQIAERIKPVGEVYLGSVPAAVASNTSAPAADTSTVAAAEVNGEQVYQQVCSACHAAGVLNAPKPGDKAAWEPRLAKGIDSVYASAINGIGTMPAKGGRVDMSDDAIKAAVDYLLAQ